MKTLLLIMALACFSCLGLAEDIPKTRDRQSLQGEWIVESATANGVKVEEAAGVRYTFSGDQLAIKDPKGKEMKYSFTIATAAKPKLLVLQPEQALTNATLCSAAYELDGDSLRIVIGNPGTRPTAVSDKDQILAVLKRNKKP